MATTTATASGIDRRSSTRLGAGLMALAGLGFVGYAVIFFVLNFTDQFLELGISANEVPVGRDTLAHLGLIYLATAVFVAGAVLSRSVGLRTGPSSHQR